VEKAVCALGLPSTRVCSLHPGDLDDVRRDFRKVAAALDAPERGEGVVAAFEERLAEVRARFDASGAEPLRVVLLEWLAPPMVAGGWMPELAIVAGAHPLIVEAPGRFVEADWKDVAAADPDVVIILPCGFDVRRTLRELEDPSVATGLRRIRAVREGRCFVLDGNAYFNRPGPRLADSAGLLASVLHPPVFAEARERYPGAWAAWR
jgi:iron complex transport system substrate-binding protein